MSAPETQYKQPSAVAPGQRETGRSPAATGPVVPLWVGRMLAWLVFAFSLIAAVLLLIAFFLQLTVPTRRRRSPRGCTAAPISCCSHSARSTRQ